MQCGHKAAHCCHGSLNCAAERVRSPVSSVESSRLRAHHSAAWIAPDFDFLSNSKPFRISLASLLPTDGELQLQTMGLVNYPMPDRWQNFSVSTNVSKQQRMVGHHDIWKTCIVYELHEQSTHECNRGTWSADTLQPLMVTISRGTERQRIPSASGIAVG